MLVIDEHAPTVPTRWEEEVGEGGQRVWVRWSLRRGRWTPGEVRSVQPT